MLVNGRRNGFLTKFYLIILLFSTGLGSFAWAMSSEEFRQKVDSFTLAEPTQALSIEALRLRSRNLPSNQIMTAEIEEAYLDMANDFLQQHLLQDAIWVLQDAGHLELADLLKTKIVQLMESTPPLRIERKTARNLDRIHFSSRIIGMFKYHGPLDNPNGEISAYELSEALGLYFVPYTFRFTEGGREGSLQIFVPNLEAGNIDFRTTKYTEDTALLFALDTLARNLDRNHTNWLKGTGRRNIVAIDHGLTYVPEAETDPYYKDFVPQGLTRTSWKILLGSPGLTKLVSASDADLRRRLANNVPTETIEFYIQQRALLLDKPGINAKAIPDAQQPCKPLLTPET